MGGSCSNAIPKGLFGLVSKDTAGNSGRDPFDNFRSGTYRFGIKIKREPNRALIDDHVFKMQNISLEKEAVMA